MRDPVRDRERMRAGDVCETHAANTQVKLKAAGRAVELQSEPGSESAIGGGVTALHTGRVGTSCGAWSHMRHASVGVRRSNVWTTWMVCVHTLSQARCVAWAVTVIGVMCAIYVRAIGTHFVVRE